MYYLTVDDVVVVLRATGAPADVRDLGLLSAAVARPQASAFGELAYPDPWHQAASLLHSLTSSHPFVDGNKRAGWNAAWTFLEINDVGTLAADFDIDAAEALMLAVANGQLDAVADIAVRLERFDEAFDD